MFKPNWSSTGLTVGLIFLLLTAVACTGKPPPLEVVELEADSTDTPDPGKATVARIELSPTAPTVVIGGQGQLSAVTQDAQGNELTGPSVAWSSDNQQIITVNAATGAITGVAEGSANITAISEGIAQTVQVTVQLASVAILEITPVDFAIVVGGEGQLTAISKDALDNELGDRPVAWVSDDPKVAFVDSATGLVTGVSAGSASIKATVEGVEQQVAVTVNLAPVASIEISPLSPNVNVGGQNPLVPSLRDAGGTELKGRTVDWTSDNEDVAKVDGEGLITGVTEGKANITASSEGVETSTIVTVALTPVASITILQNDQSVEEDEVLQLEASLKDAANNPLQGRSIVWTSGSLGIAIVDPSTGLVIGVQAGQAVITAQSEGKQATTNVTVKHRPVKTIELSSGAFSVVEGTKAQGGTGETLAATLKDDLGHIITGSVSWSSEDQAVAVVSQG